MDAALPQLAYNGVDEWIAEAPYSAQGQEYLVTTNGGHGPAIKLLCSDKAQAKRIFHEYITDGLEMSFSSRVFMYGGCECFLVHPRMIESYVFSGAMGSGYQILLLTRKGGGADADPRA